MWLDCDDAKREESVLLRFLLLCSQRSSCWAQHQERGFFLVLLGLKAARCVPLCSLSAEAGAAGLSDIEGPISHPKGCVRPCPAPSSNRKRKAKGAFSAPPAQILSAWSSCVSSSPCPRLWLCRRNSTPFFRCLPVPTAILAFPEFC